MMQVLNDDIRLSWDLYYSYENFKEHTITKKTFSHSDILPLILKLQKNNLFKVEKAGSSIEERDIYLISTGKGKTKILLWSQMHGDESTATMALFDIFNFLSSADGFHDFRKKILDNITFYFIPMLNPDGAEKFKRRNAVEIDLNRDALMLNSPEALLLKRIRDEIKADFGFNLHDQCSRYSAGKCFRHAAVSFLAPPFNQENEINAVRRKAMQLIAYMNNILSIYIPGHIAKYNDDFEPRAFGDNIQKWGTSTALIESGGWCGDYEKQFIRKLNFIALLSAFNCISKRSFKNINTEEYVQIPENEEILFDLILRNVTLKLNNKNYTADIGINREETFGEDRSLYYKSNIEDIGDLSVFYGIEELDCSNMSAEPGGIYDKTFSSIDEISKLDIDKLLERGITNFFIDPIESGIEYTSLPVIIQTAKAENASPLLSVDTIPNFLLKTSGKLRYVVINGFIYDVLTRTNNIYNGLILK
jgi:hypothetical protein